jgi:hypothetical protein
VLFVLTLSQEPSPLVHDVIAVEYVENADFLPPPTPPTKSRKKNRTSKAILSQDSSHDNVGRLPRPNVHNVAPNSGEASSSQVPNRGGGTDDKYATADNFDRSLTYSEVTDITPLLMAVHDRIDSNLNFQWELTKEDDQVVTAVIEVVINSDGTLRKIISGRSSSPSVLVFIQKATSELLAKPLPRRPRRDGVVVVSLEFHFETVQRELLPVSSLPKAVKNHLHFFRARHSPSLVEAHNTLLGGDSKVFDIRLEVLYRRLFGKKPSDLARMQWDIHLKLNEAVSACDREAEGACAEAGKIYEAIGKTAEAKTMYSRGCDLKYEVACEAYRRLISR